MCRYVTAQMWIFACVFVDSSSIAAIVTSIQHGFRMQKCSYTVLKLILQAKGTNLASYFKDNTAHSGLWATSY